MSNPNDIQFIEGDAAERQAIETERTAERHEAEQLTAKNTPEPSAAGSSGDPLEGLVERALVDKSVVYLPSVLAALAGLAKTDQPSWQRTLERLKSEAKVGLTELRKAVSRAAQKLEDERAALQAEERRRAAQARAEDLRQAAIAARNGTAERFAAHFANADGYAMAPGIIEGRVQLGQTERTVTLAFYSARITAEIEHFDAQSTSSVYEIEVLANDRLRHVRVKGDEYSAMKWPALAGADVVTAAGSKLRDEARVAIQLLSRPIARRTEFGLTGWRRIDDREVFLHAGGAINAPEDASVTVKMPERAGKLGWLALPAALEGEDLKRGVTQCLEVMFAHVPVTLPLCAAAWRAVLGQNRNVLFVYGTQKIGKTTAMLWAQNHFATRYTTADTPLSWSSTAFGIRAALAAAGDMVLLVDDFRPAQDPKQAVHFAEIVRNVFDGTSRVKGTVDSTTVQDPTPRALPLISGETRPKIDSVNSRIVAIPMTEKLPLGRDRVAEFDAWAKGGRFSGTMAAFITWLAEGDRLALTRRRHADETEAFAAELATITREGRSARSLAGLWAGVLPFLRFAHAVGAITVDEGKRASEEIAATFRQLAEEQIAQQEDEDVVARFFRYLSSALASGLAHLTNIEHQAPELPGRWGWQVLDSNQVERTVTTAAGNTVDVQPKYRPTGRRVGTLHKGLVYLDRSAAMAVVQKSCNDANEPFAIDGAGLADQLFQRGLLAKVEGDPSNPNSRTVRLYEPAPGSPVKKQRSGYLCVKADLLCEEVTADSEAHEPAPDPFDPIEPI